MKIKMTLAFFAVFLSACHIRGGEPTESELFGAVKAHLEHFNDRGGMKINMGNAGAFQNIQFDFKLQALTKHSCTGSENTYTCKVTGIVTFPPVKDEPEELDWDVIIFDGPGGWRLIDAKLTDRRLPKN